MLVQCCFAYHSASQVNLCPRSCFDHLRIDEALRQGSIGPRNFKMISDDLVRLQGKPQLCGSVCVLHLVMEYIISTAA